MPDGLLEKIKAAEAAKLGGATNTATPMPDAAGTATPAPDESPMPDAASDAPPAAAPAPDGGGSLLSKIREAEAAQHGANVPRGTKYRSLQPPDNGVNPDIVSQDLKNSTDYWTNFYLFPGVKPPQPTPEPQKAVPTDVNAPVTLDSNRLSERLYEKESKNMGGYKAMNEHTNALGKYQFVPSYFWDSIKEQTGVKTYQEFLDSPEKQEAFFQYHVKNNLAADVKALRKHNKQGYSDEQLAMLAHFKGQADAAKWLETGNDPTKKNNISIPSYLGKPEGGSGNANNSQEWEGFPHQLPPGYKPSARNMSVDQAKQATGAEIKAAQNYLGKFYQENPEMQKYMTIGGLGPGQGMMDPQSGLNRVLNTAGDGAALSTFSGNAMSLLAEKKKADLAALENDFPMTGGSVSAMNDFAAPRMRANEAGYDAAKAKIEKEYAEKEQNLRNSLASVAQLKVSNEFLQQHGTTKNISPADAQEVGWRYMEAVGDGKTAQRQRQMFMQNRLSPAEKVEAQRLGYKALQYKMMEAASNDQKAVAENLATHVNGYQDKIRNANPEFVKQQVADAISDDINKEEYKGSFWAKVWGVHPDEEMIKTSAKRLGLPSEVVAGIKPSDIKAKRAGVLGQWASGLISTTAAPLYEFSMRHLLPTNDAAVEKRFDENWYDNSDVAHYVGGQSLPSDALKQGATNINTDPTSDEYLMNTRNAEAGQWNFDASNVIGIAATGLGNLSGFSKGIGGSAGVISKLGAGAKTAENLGLATYMYLSNFDNNMKEARAALGGDEADEGKATLLANMYTMADIFGMKIVDPVKRLSPGFGKNVMGGKEFIDKLAKGGIKEITRNEIARTFAQGLKQSGINLAEMTAGMDGITAGRYLADMILAPEKFSTQDTAEGFVESTVNAAIINAIPAIFGGFSTAHSKNRMMQDALYDVGSNPRPYLDAIDANVEKGGLNPQDAAKQKQVINTLTDIVNNSVPERSLANGQPLTDAQKKEYAANLFDAAVLNAKKENVKDDVQIKHIEKYINELKGQREEILNNAGEPAPPAEEVTAEGDKQSELAKGDAIQWDVFGNEDEGTWTVGDRVKTRGGKDAVELSKEYVESSVDGKTYTKEYADKNGIPYENAPSIKTHVVPLEDLNVKKQETTPQSLQENVAAGDGEQQPGTEQSSDTQSVDNGKPTAEDNVTVGELMDRPVTYRGEDATLVQDGQTVVVKMKEPSAEGREREYELGNIDEIRDHGIKDYGIEQQNSVVEVSDEGNIKVRGKEYVNNYSDPLQAISRDKDGNRVVNLETADGKKRTFRGAVAEDIAYHLTLKETAKHEQGKLEDFINSDNEARTAIEEARSEPEPAAAVEPTEPGQTDNGRSEKTTTEQAVGDNGTISEKPKAAAEPVAIKRNGEVLTDEAATRAEAKVEKIISDSKTVEDARQRIRNNDLQFDMRHSGMLNEYIQDRIDGKTDVSFAEWRKGEPQPSTVSSSKSKRAKIERKAQPTLFEEPAAEPAKPEKQVHPDFDFEEEPSVAAKVKEKAAKTQAAPAASEATPSAAPRMDREAQRKAGDDFVSSARTAEETAETRKVGGNIRAKFENNDKYLGNAHTEVLSDGSELHGHYMLVPADAVTPSHDPMAGFRTSKGFPTLEDGRNPNDRDYTDKNTAAKVQARANGYDGRAITQMPTVDKNGVVINGNDRTMASQLAARNKTDGKYLEVLKKNVAQYGFSPEQVEAMERGGRAPRVIFVPDEVLPYTTKTFSRFNPETTGKVKTSKEKAATLANTVSDDAVRRLGDEMGKFDGVAEFYGSKPAMRAVIEVLRKEGVITNDNLPQYFDTDHTITQHGRELLQNLMLGKVFGDKELKLLANHNDIRSKMLYSMGNVMGIEALGKEYSLKPYFDEALHLWDTVEQFKEKNNLNNMSDALNMYLRSGNMFEKFSTEAINIFHEFNSLRKAPLREFTGNYLEAAKSAIENAAKGTDIFGNAPVSASREQMINEYAENKRQLEELELTRTSDDQLNDGRTTGTEEQVLPGSDTGQEAVGANPGEGNAGEPARTELQPEQPAAPIEGEQPAAEQQPAPETQAEEKPYQTPEEPNNVVEEAAPEYGKEDPTPVPEGKELTEREKQYTAAIKESNKYKGYIRTKDGNIARIEADMHEMQRNRQMSTPEYQKLKTDLEKEQRAKRQYELKKKAADLEVRRFEGKRLSDEIRRWKNKLADDRAYAVPVISPALFRDRKSVV